jgi:hypothetical protein
LTVDGQDYSIAGRVLVSESPPEAHLEVAKQWLDKCLSSHIICREHSQNFPELPIRVIDVGQHDVSPRLIDGSGISSSYATLSHCWGHAPTIKTELKTLELLQQQIYLATLPKTFREAIMVCRKLEIPYLWIDSLCIIQDSKEDWEFHSSGMFLVTIGMIHC